MFIPKILRRVTSKFDSNALIQQIHDEFDTAEDRLLAGAKELLAKLASEQVIDIEDKAKRLESVGFTATPTVKQFKVYKETQKVKGQQIVKTQEEAECIQHYKTHYPSLKFLTETELDRICTKYNLIYAPVANFTEEVPDKNLKDIENAPKLKNDDHMPVKYFVQVVDFIASCPNDIQQILRRQNVVDHDFYALTNDELLNICKANGYNGNFKGSIAYSWHQSKSKIDSKGLFICAPKSHFNLEGLTNDGKLGFFNITVLQKGVKDPIVFRYVKGGIQVITKWGLEANDELLINETIN